MAEIKKIKNTYNNWQELEHKTNEIIDNGGGGGGGTDAVWGRIQGNIVAQTDLMTQLGYKADKDTVYTKAQADALLDTKQNVLSAGTGITIANDVISTHIINDTRASATTTWSSNEIKSRFEAISGSAKIVVVSTMPVSPEDNTLYYVETAVSGLYDIKLQSAGVLYNMGSTQIDLSQYYTKTEINTMLSDKADVSTTYTKTQTDTLLSAKADTTDVELLANKVTSISNASTNVQYPSAKAVYDNILSHTTGNVEIQPVTTYITTRNLPYIKIGRMVIVNFNLQMATGITITRQNVIAKLPTGMIPQVATTFVIANADQSVPMYLKTNGEIVNEATMKGDTLATNDRWYDGQLIFFTTE